MIAHVLRYTPFFETIKKIIDSGELVSIQHNENIGYWHYAHSFTIGNWKNSNETSPLILSKSCHDMDILSWLTTSKCKKIAAFGSLSSLCSKDYDKNTMSERCLDCSVEESCPYSAIKLYLGEEPIMVNYLDPNPTRENVLRAGAPNGDYYNLETVITDEIVNNIPEKVSLVYWDYYTSDEDKYNKLFKIREKFSYSKHIDLVG